MNVHGDDSDGFPIPDTATLWPDNEPPLTTIFLTDGLFKTILDGLQSILVP